MYLVLNLDDSTDPNFQNGTHWIGIYKKDNLVYYFNSFGNQPPQEVTDYFNTEKIGYNSYQIQTMDSNNCGLYVIMFLTAMQQGIEYEAFVNYFGDNDNDTRINL